MIFQTDLSPVHFVKLELRDAEGKLLSDNFYWRALPTNSVDYTSLDKIAPRSSTPASSATTPTANACST